MPPRSTSRFLVLWVVLPVLVCYLAYSYMNAFDSLGSPVRSRVQWLLTRQHASDPSSTLQTETRRVSTESLQATLSSSAYAPGKNRYCHKDADLACHRVILMTRGA
ncbi:hypothetical protein BC939DRAFT_286422 [Gamsiella multidivaricata]|uniref:uncharacterized protein n=1 Tax=Gamsiella multidivaricata TaxID=101098 RepID=UPI00221FE723|nr:uncharacterized protein BC939DRAFT_286422 [Gamsiella multidivaricata]KAI7818693.1 hypothetical protein BC939DRAFT_286422 [Gamsiella multidivaricata]